MLAGTSVVRAQSSRGDLSVTATVVASVGLEIGPDGKQRLVVANASDPRDNVSRLVASGNQLTTQTDPKKPAKKADHNK
ncbi:MAG: hypothetical protein WA738_19165 [Candidatus Angelobacter sp.]